MYEPNTHIKEVLRKERVPLTPARAMLLDVLFDLTKEGEFVSEFASEKVCYFLQRFGGKDLLKLSYKPYFYGPYSGVVRHVLYHLNGSYLSGYQSKDKKPFEFLQLVYDGEQTVTDYLNQPAQQTARTVVDQTKRFLRGFYSYFGLELLSTVDYLGQERQTSDPVVIQQALDDWSERKGSQFSDARFLHKAIARLRAFELLP